MRIPGALSATFYLVAVAIAGCAPSEKGEAPGAEEAAAPVISTEELAPVSMAWQEALATSDVEGIMALYGDEPVAMPPYEPAVAGADAVRAWFEDFLGQNLEEPSLTTDGVLGSGDWAFVRGTYQFRVAGEEGAEPAVVTGKWISIDQRQPDGSWKIVRNLWNTDAPPAGVTAPEFPATAEVPELMEPVCVTDPTGTEQAFVEAFNEGDLAKVVATHAPDGARLPPGSTTIQGSAALAGFFSYFFDTFATRDLKVMQEGSAVTDDAAATWGTYEFAYAPAEGEGVSGSGKYIVISTPDENGCWREQWVIWNSDSMPETGGA